MKNLPKKVWNAIRKDWGSWVLLVPSVILFVAMVWQPLLSSIRLSFYETKGFEVVEFTGLDNYVKVMSNSAFIKTLKNTVTYVGWSLVIGYLIPVVVAVLLNEMVHAKGFFRFCCYFPVMIPGMAASLLWYFVFYPGEGGFLNSVLNGTFRVAAEFKDSHSPYCNYPDLERLRIKYVDLSGKLAGNQ